MIPLDRQAEKMVSNKLTNRRLTARKPPVCNSGPAVGSILFPQDAVQLKRQPLEKKLPGITSPIVPRLGRCPPPPPAAATTCTLEPTNVTLELSESEAFIGAACNPALPDEEEVNLEWTADGGETSVGQDPTNCSLGAQMEFYSDEPGDFTLTALYTFSNGTTCQKTAAVHVNEEEEMPEPSPGGLPNLPNPKLLQTACQTAKVQSNHPNPRERETSW